MYSKRGPETVSAKADRLVANYRVILTGGHQALVIGDHNTYTVSRPGASWTCSCPWGRYKGRWKHCSHVVAVRRALIEPASQVPVARLAELLEGAVR